MAGRGRMEVLPRFHPSNLPNLIVQEGVLRKSYSYFDVSQDTTIETYPLSFA